MFRANKLANKVVSPSVANLVCSTNSVPQKALATVSPANDKVTTVLVECPFSINHQRPNTQHELIKLNQPIKFGELHLAEANLTPFHNFVIAISSISAHSSILSASKQQRLMNWPTTPLPCVSSRLTISSIKQFNPTHHISSRHIFQSPNTNPDQSLTSFPLSPNPFFGL